MLEDCWWVNSSGDTDSNSNIGWNFNSYDSYVINNSNSFFVLNR